MKGEVIEIDDEPTHRKNPRPVIDLSDYYPSSGDVIEISDEPPPKKRKDQSVTLTAWTPFGGVPGSTVSFSSLDLRAWKQNFYWDPLSTLPSEVAINVLFHLLSVLPTLSKSRSDTQVRNLLYCSTVSQHWCKMMNEQPLWKRLSSFWKPELTTRLLLAQNYHWKQIFKWKWLRMDMWDRAWKQSKQQQTIGSILYFAFVGQRPLVETNKVRVVDLMWVVSQTGTQCSCFMEGSNIVQFIPPSVEPTPTVLQTLEKPRKGVHPETLRARFFGPSDLVIVSTQSISRWHWNWHQGNDQPTFAIKIYANIPLNAVFDLSAASGVVVIGDQLIVFCLVSGTVRVLDKDLSPLGTIKAIVIGPHHVVLSSTNGVYVYYTTVDIGKQKASLHQLDCFLIHGESSQVVGIGPDQEGKPALLSFPLNAPNNVRVIKKRFHPTQTKFTIHNTNEINNVLISVGTAHIQQWDIQQGVNKRIYYTSSEQTWLDNIFVLPQTPDQPLKFAYIVGNKDGARTLIMHQLSKRREWRLERVDQQKDSLHMAFTDDYLAWNSSFLSFVLQVTESAVLDQEIPMVQEEQGQ